MILNDNAIVTWFHADEHEESGIYAQTLGDSSRIAHANVYFDCAITFFASLEILQRSEFRYFVLNTRGFDLLSKNRLNILKRLNVNIVIIENSHIPPEKFGKKWKNQFYVLDIVSYFAKMKKNLFIFDSDVVCVSSNELNFDSYEVQGIQINRNSLSDINGLSPDSYFEIFRDFFGEEMQGPPVYYGGEYYGIRSDKLSQFSALLEKAYDKNIKRLESDQIFATEEAHLVSIVFQHFKVDEVSNTLLDRIWTQPWTFRYIPDYWRKLIFLHLPAEKKTGIRKVAQYLEKILIEGKDLPGSTDFLTYSLRNFGIPSYGLTKLFADFWSLRKGVFRHIKNRVIGF